MKTLAFNYSKKDGSTSERLLLAMVEPGDKYAGIDLSDMDPEAAQAFIILVKAAQAKYLEELRTLQQEFDIKYNYRQFLASGVSNIEQVE